MSQLVIHQNFLDQFRRLIQPWGQRPGWDVRGVPRLPGFDGLARYSLARKGRAIQHPYLRQMGAAVLHGQSVARQLLAMKQRGWRPDVVLAHPGWGETLYVKNVFPDTRLIHYCEWFYNSEGSDIGLDPESSATFDDRARIRTWNAMNLENCAQAVTPTRWQWNQHRAIA